VPKILVNGGGDGSKQQDSEVHFQATLIESQGYMRWMGDPFVLSLTMHSYVENST
jgi:hypothetical protein